MVVIGNLKTSMTVLKLLIMETVLFRVYDVTNIDDNIDAHNNDFDMSGNNYDNIRFIIYDDRSSGDIDQPRQWYR